MFQQLSQKLTAAFKTLKGRGILTEQDVTAALREVRVALLEADVALSVVKALIERIKERAVGVAVLSSVTPEQQIIKIVHEAIIEILGSEPIPLNLNGKPPVVIMLAGLQGAGKTTFAGKLTHHLKQIGNKKILLASVDTYRPAAQHQLEILANTQGVGSVPIIPGQSPLEIAKRAYGQASLEGYDVLIVDTAGRLHVDEALMEELQALQKFFKPLETLMIADSMTGQDAVTAARHFQDNIAITGIVLSRVDGDARGGAALSLRHVLEKPIKFLGTGERPEDVMVFDPRRIADRILDRGDVVALVEKAAQAIDQDQMEDFSRQFEEGVFTLNDMQRQLSSMLKLGGMSGLLGMLPGMGGIKEALSNQKMDDKIIHRQIAIIRSMTPRERQYPKLLNAARRRRIAAGSGVQVSDINRLIKQFEQMQKMMKSAKKLKQRKGSFNLSKLFNMN